MEHVKATGSVASPSFVHLDMARGIAALLVLFGHLRSFVFISYGELRHHTPIDMAVWLLTGFGHQSVMIFFVLSGFFIARSIVVDDRSRGFAWPVYLVKRLSRLWIVLLPCLVLTLFWDNLGILMTGTKFYSGDLYSIYNSGPSSETGGTHLEASTFFGNLFFLQTILVPILGSNGPLWSLSNEFWYYILFPFLFLAVTRKTRPTVLAVNILLFLAVCIFVGKYMLLSGLIWLGGVFVYIAYERRWCARWLKTRAALFLAVAMLLAALAFSKGSIGDDLVKDYVVGAGSAMLVLTLSHFEARNRIYLGLAEILAEGSYTVYLVHFSFMAFLVNFFLHNQKFEASWGGYAIFVCIAMITIAYCFGIYWLFERHTGAVRRYCLSMLRQRQQSTVGN